MTPKHTNAEEIKNDLFKGRFQEIHFTSQSCSWKKPGEMLPSNYRFQFEEKNGSLFLHLINEERNFNREYKIFLQSEDESSKHGTHWLLPDDDDSILLTPKS